MNKIIPKGLAALLDDDPSLKRKLTYEEYQAGESAPDNSDYQIEEVYKEYRLFLKKESAE